MADGSVCIFPMFAENRRMERRQDIIDQLHKEFIVSTAVDYSNNEAQKMYLEGTGSMVMDHDNKIIYACISERTHPQLLIEFAKDNNYAVIPFKAKDKSGLPVYHTNVLMCIGNNFCVICDEVIDEVDRNRVLTSLKNSCKQLISISYDQMLNFAGNMLQLQNKKDEPVLVMSSSAYDALADTQKEQMQSFTQLLPVNINTIETIGGGSARCMMAEIFLDKRLQ
jgi:hypothetical protein